MLCKQPHLPGSQTGGAHQVPAGLDLHILIILCAYLTKLESGAHFTVQLILLLQGEGGRGDRLALFKSRLKFCLICIAV